MEFARRVYYGAHGSGKPRNTHGTPVRHHGALRRGDPQEHRQWYAELVRLGYTDVWSAETDGTDGFTPLALASAWSPSLNLGVAIIPAYTRGPALLAQSVAAMAEAAPGRFTLGLGTSSDVIVSRWNGIPFTEPYRRARDTIRFLRAALAGEKVDNDYPTFAVRGFRLARPVENPPPIFLAALRPGMLKLAGREADGVIINWLSAEDVSTVTPELGADIPVAARIFVCPSEDTETVRAVGRRMIAAYLNVGVYAEFHRWLGRGSVLEPMWTAWRTGDRKGALASHSRRGRRLTHRPWIVRRLSCPRRSLRGQRSRNSGDGGHPHRCQSRGCHRGLSSSVDSGPDRFHPTVRDPSGMRPHDGPTRAGQVDAYRATISVS